MAEKRMFSKTIIDSDVFLDMPLSTQALYFHLSMRADDDGFLNNSKKIMRIIGANENDMDLLLVKKFIIQFEDGICVIKHWRIHNYIQTDRYHETNYKREKSMLNVDENKAYTFDDTGKKLLGNKIVNSSCIQDVYKLDTSCTQNGSADKTRLDKNRLDKTRLGKNSTEENIGGSDLEILKIAEQRNFILSPIQMEQIITDVKQYSFNEVSKALEIADNNGKHTYSYVKGILERRRASDNNNGEPRKTSKWNYTIPKARELTEEEKRRAAEELD